MDAKLTIGITYEGAEVEESIKVNTTHGDIEKLQQLLSEVVGSQVWDLISAAFIKLRCAIDEKAQTITEEVEVVNVMEQSPVKKSARNTKALQKS